MSERTPKQPLNDPEYTVPEYSVLLPSNEPENSTAEGDAAPETSVPTSTTPSGAVDTGAAEDERTRRSASEHASTPSANHYWLPGGDRRLHCRLRAGNSGAPEGYAQRHVVRCRHYRCWGPE